jgi:hypothetical protein
MDPRGYGRQEAAGILCLDIHAEVNSARVDITSTYGIMRKMGATGRYQSTFGSP